MENQVELELDRFLIGFIQKKPNEDLEHLRDIQTDKLKRLSINMKVIQFQAL